MFDKKNVFVFGMARSGYEASKVLIKENANVTIYDSNEKQDLNHINELKSLGVKIIFGGYSFDMLNNIDLMVKNPGIKDSHELVCEAYKRNIPVINEVELAYELLPNVSIIGITGTNGKTTTTKLTYEIMKNAYADKVHLVGNIGYPLCSIVDKAKDGDIVVMEFSCQQSVNIKEFHPHVGLITNFSLAHIDMFKTYKNYKESKCKMVYNELESDIAILNSDDKDVIDCTLNAKCKKKYFSINDKRDCYLKDNTIYYDNKPVICISDIKIPGMHNVYNVMSAICIAKEYDVSDDIIKSTISNFKGVRHRLEYIDEIHGVMYYNDTESTNIKCAEIALSSFDKPIILILGGLDRGQNFDDLKSYMSNVKTIIGIGECRNRIEEFGKKLGINTYIFERLNEAFDKIQEISSAGDVVLLSPASASWDQYKECEERGDEFRNLVLKWREENE